MRAPLERFGAANQGLKCGRMAAILRFAARRLTEPAINRPNGPSRVSPVQEYPKGLRTLFILKSSG